ncbi:MAG: UDP-N-acetylmuramoyl-L-alanine--D-glutamate ligase [Propionibacteriaceae bacterium]|jgi:UDP-N-acetylmuramoylalanine--D-glutamate ligase|nr:UDP-N-acetylmuramoyl-L-alanine--D-glutamate ligase [Propionibacteriaceae bacterium]
MGSGAVIEWLDNADRYCPWAEAKVVVAGLGAAGFASADALLEVGAQVLAVDDSASETVADRAALLEVLGAQIRIGPGSSQLLDVDADLVIASPGWHPGQPLLRQAAARGVPIWGDIELAWRMMHPDRVVPWLAITGTDGKTTTTQMLASILAAAGLKVAAVGNIGRPIIEAINDEIDYDVFAVELGAPELHWVHSLRPHSAAVLNVYPDHLEWYADVPDPAAAADPYAGYTADKARIYHQVTHCCVYNVDEPLTRKLVEDADVVEGARAIGFTLGIPGLGMLGVVDDLLVDRAFIEQRATSALPLAAVSDVRANYQHNISNALAAAALARSFGVNATAVAQGLRDFQIDRHRIETIAEIDNVAYVDDSKATNWHAARGSLTSFEHVVWIAGGQTKGLSFDELVSEIAPRLRGVVLIGVGRGDIAAALARQAPEVPVVVLDEPTSVVMHEAVRAAAAMAEPGDTVLLAPAAASRDMWTGYEARGASYREAVYELPQGDA